MVMFWNVRPGRAVGERLQDVRALAGQEDLRPPVAVEVLAGDAHAPDPERLPAIVGRVQRRWLARCHAPELLLAVAQVAVVVAVVADAQVALAGSVPVAEEHRQGAPRRRQRHGRREAAAARGRTDELVGLAELGRVGERLVVVVAERQGRPRRAGFPRRAEGRRPFVAAIERPGLVGTLEATVPAAAEEHVLAISQHRQVRDAVAVDVDRVGAGDGLEVGHWVGHGLEAQRATDRAVIAKQGGRLAAAGEVELRAPVVVTVEGRHAATDEVAEVAVVDMLDAGRCRLFDIRRRWRRDRRQAPHEGRDDERRDHDRDAAHDDEGGRRQPEPSATGTDGVGHGHRGIEAQPRRAPRRRRQVRVWGRRPR